MSIPPKFLNEDDGLKLVYSFILFFVKMVFLVVLEQRFSLRSTKMTKTKKNMTKTMKSVEIGQAF